MWRLRQVSKRRPAEQLTEYTGSKTEHSAAKKGRKEISAPFINSLSITRDHSSADDSFEDSTQSFNLCSRPILGCCPCFAFCFFLSSMMDFDTAFNTIPIIAGVIFGCFFLIILLCIVCRLCAAMNKSPPTLVGPTTVSDINSQFNQPLSAPAPYHTFASTPYAPSAPSAPSENYPLDPWHHYPTDPSHPIHHQQNIYNGQLSSATSPPMPHSDAPPSYSEVTASY